MDLNTATNNVVNNFASANGQTADALDPAIITLIGQLIPQVLQVFNNCIQARMAKNAAAKPSVIQKAALNMTVRRNIGWLAFRQHGNEISTALLKSASETSDDELIELANAAQDY